MQILPKFTASLPSRQPDNGMFAKSVALGVTLSKVLTVTTSQSEYPAGILARRGKSSRLGDVSPILDPVKRNLVDPRISSGPS